MTPPPNCALNSALASGQRVIRFFLLDVCARGALSFPPQPADSFFPLSPFFLVLAQDLEDWRADSSASIFFAAAISRNVSPRPLFYDVGFPFIPYTLPNR